MTAPGDIPDLPDDDAILREIAAMDLDLARRFHGAVMAEPDDAKAADLSRAYNRVTRSLRQCLALRAKLVHDRENHRARHTPIGSAFLAKPVAKPVEPAPAKPAPSAAAELETNRRRAVLMRALPRIIWNEREAERLDRPQAARLRARIEDEVFEGKADMDPNAVPVEDLIATVCRRHGLRYNPAWETLREPPQFWLYPSLQAADDG